MKVAENRWARSSPERRKASRQKECVGKGKEVLGSSVTWTYVMSQGGAG